MLERKRQQSKLYLKIFLRKSASITFAISTQFSYSLEASPRTYVIIIKISSIFHDKTNVLSLALLQE